MAKIDEDLIGGIEALLVAGWNNSNTGSRTPIIDKIFDRPPHIDLSSNDWVFVYSRRPTTKQIASVSYLTETMEGFVTVDIRTDVSHAQSDLMYYEVERLRIANKTDPIVGWHTWEYLEAINLSDRVRGWYRIVIDYKIKVISTQAI